MAFYIAKSSDVELYTAIRLVTCMYTGRYSLDQKVNTRRRYSITIGSSNSFDNPRVCLVGSCWRNSGVPRSSNNDVVVLRLCLLFSSPPPQSRHAIRTRRFSWTTSPPPPKFWDSNPIEIHLKVSLSQSRDLFKPVLFSNSKVKRVYKSWETVELEADEKRSARDSFTTEKVRDSSRM